MNDLKAPIDTLKEKIEQLITSHAKLTERLKITEDENVNLAHLLKEKEAEGAAGMDLVERNNTLANQLLEKEIMLEEQDARIKLLLLVEADLKSAQAENAELVAKLKESQSAVTGTPALAEENALLTKQLADKDARITELLQAEADLAAAKAENAELAGKLKDSQAPVADIAGSNEQTAALLKQLEEKEALLAEKENQLKESGLLLKELGETNNLHNLAQSISGNTGSEQNEELKLIITDLVKEIDKCITLLGKNV